MNIRVSVAMATYNGEKYLREQLDSIIDNLETNDEIVISDDGSTDATLNIIHEYMEHDNRIRLVSGPQDGIIANFENAILNSRGQYIFLSDQDDIWSDKKVKRILEIFGNTNTKLVIHDACVVDSTMQNVLYDSFFGYRCSRPGVVANVIKNRYMGCCMAFERELIQKMMPFPRNIQMHDQWIGLMNDIYYEDSVFLEEILLQYRRHDGVASDFSHNKILKMIWLRFVLGYEMLKRIIKNGLR